MSIVVPEFLGRFGNQCFQIACAIGYARKHNFKYFIPKNYHHKEIYNYFPNIPVFQGDVSTLFKYDVANDFGFRYKEIPKYKDGVKIRGFFQSIKFFEHCQDEVRQVLKLNETPVDYVGIHVRRGDYLQYPDQFPPVTMKYLGEAITLFKDKGYKDFLVFSDDRKWCINNLPKNFQDCTFKFSEGDAYTDLSLMASCEHNIIANSSFSWFAAWYNRNTNKIVVSPSKETWFGPKCRLDTSTLLPDNWIKIHTR